MPAPTNGPQPLTSYKVLSFDVYGTLVEYKSQILASFGPLLHRLQPPSPYLDDSPLSPVIPGCATVGQITFLKLFQKTEDTIKLEKPVKRFDIILAEIWRRIAHELNVETSETEALSFGSSANIASWPVFKGTVEALQNLSKYYKLVALSNIDQYAWEITSKSPLSALGEIDWFKVFTAENFGEDATRADEAKLETLLSFCAEKGVPRDEVLHVAQSLGHDHAPAKRLGISSVFLVGDGRKWGKEAESKMVLEKELVGYGWRCRDLKEFAEVVTESWNT